MDMKAERREETFVMRRYFKSELALLYNPGSEPRTALQALYRWMQRIPRLQAELEEVGYNKFGHQFRRQEVEIIVKYLGEP